MLVSVGQGGVTFQRGRRLFITRELNPLNAELNPICHLLALLAHHILHVSRIRVKRQVDLAACAFFHFMHFIKIMPIEP